MKRSARHPLELPLGFAGVLMGMSLLALIIFPSPRWAIALVVLSLVVVLAILRDIILNGGR